MNDRIDFYLRIVELTFKELEEDWNDTDQIVFNIEWCQMMDFFRDELVPAYENDKMNEVQKQRYLAIKDYLEKNDAMLKERQLWRLSAD